MTPEIKHWHVHIYFSSDTRDKAESLWNFFRTKPLYVWVGRMHDQPLGPHKGPQFQLGIETKNLSLILSHLALYRDGLSVLVHPETGDDVKDHTDSCFWLGDKLDLDLDRL